mmetsp:Transcript_116326/g.183989  ORF Transcript_116326/g.183989 Transcript_116326/m.183989 type:complete len:376 (+) Transcript_116326:89-1216(+)
MPKKARRSKCTRCGGTGKRGLFGATGLGVFSFQCPHCRERKERTKLAVTPEMENRAREAHRNSSNEHLAGLFGSDSGNLRIFALAESLLLLLTLIFLFALIGSGEIALLAMLIFSCLCHCCLQYIILLFDPGKVSSSLQLLEMESMADKDAACIIDDLQRSPAFVEVNAEGYHTEVASTTNDIEKMPLTEVIDRRESRPFVYSSWKDVSGTVSGFEGSTITSLEVVPQIECVDEATTKAKQELHKAALDACKHCQSSRSYDKIIVRHQRYEVNDRLLVMTRSPGILAPFWMRSYFYDIPRWLCPGCGCIFRALFLVKVAHVRFDLRKLVSLQKQTGLDWFDLEAGDASMTAEATLVGNSILPSKADAITTGTATF